MQSPNILLLFPDQWRWDWLGCETSPFGKVPVRTPNIDTLAERGVRFSGCRTNSPVCSPARACLATGRRYHRCGVADNYACTPVDRPTFFKLLRDAGYHTTTCGKSDLFKPDLTPTQSGYLPIMETYGFSDGIDHRGKGNAVRRGRDGIDEPYTCMLRERGLLQTHLEDHPRAPLSRPAYPTPLPADAYTDDFCGANALKLLDRAPADKPWCLWVNFPGPHDPYDPPKEFADSYEGVVFPPAVNPTKDPPSYRDVPKDRQHYAACCTNIDEWVGRLVKAVEDRGELENTVIIFASDHGEMLGDQGRWTKSIWYEASIRVPLIVAGSQIQNNVHVDTPVELIDLASTILDLSGLDAPADWDSRSFLPVLKGNSSDHRPHVVCQLVDWRCISDNSWKLVEVKGQPYELYRIDSNPGEDADVAADFPEVTERLAQLLERENPWLEAD